MSKETEFGTDISGDNLKIYLPEFEYIRGKFDAYTKIKGQNPAYVSLEDGKRYIIKDTANDMIARYKDFRKNNKDARPSFVTVKPEAAPIIIPTPQPTPAPTPTTETLYLKKGVSNLSNFMVQDYLKLHGYYVGYKSDGVFGEYTEAEVRRFQQDNGLPVTGGVGCLTWNLLVYPPCPLGQTTTPAGGDGIYPESSYLDFDQTTSYTCGPSSVYMALSTLGVPNLSEMALAGLMGTVPVSGTNPGDLINGAVEFAAQQGVNITGQMEYFSQVGYQGLGERIADPNIAVVCNGNTKGWPSYYKGTYGHYVFPVLVNMNNSTIKIADPARTVNPVYSFTEFKNGLDLVSGPSLMVFKKG